MKKLSASDITILSSGLSKLTSYKRRLYAAEIAIVYFGGSARKMERYLKVSRKMVALGLHELSSGFRCVENFSLRGAKKKSLNLLISPLI